LNNPSSVHGATSARRPQFSLSTLLLLMAVVAIGIAYRNVRQETEVIRAQIPGLLAVACELEIDDPKRFAVVSRLPQWHDEAIWDVYLPEGRSLELCLAMDKVSSDNSFPEPLHRVSIDSGVRKIEFKYARQEKLSIARLLVDDAVVIEESRPKDWEPRSGSSGGGQSFQSQQHDPDEPLVLRRRFMTRNASGGSSTPKSPSQGVLIWIESRD